MGYARQRKVTITRRKANVNSKTRKARKVGKIRRKRK